MLEWVGKGKKMTGWSSALRRFGAATEGGVRALAVAIRPRIMDAFTLASSAAQQRPSVPALVRRDPAALRKLERAAMPSQGEAIGNCNVPIHIRRRAYEAVSVCFWLKRCPRRCAVGSSGSVNIRRFMGSNGMGTIVTWLPR